MKMIAEINRVRDLAGMKPLSEAQVTALKEAATKTIKIKLKDPKVANMLSTMGSLRCTKPDEDGNALLRGTEEDLAKAEKAFAGKYTTLKEDLADDQMDLNSRVRDALEKSKASPEVFKKFEASMGKLNRALEKASEAEDDDLIASILDDMEKLAKDAEALNK